MARAVKFDQQYREVPVSELLFLEDNPRRGDLEMLEESIDELGFYGACIVDRDSMTVLAGNHRLKALVAEGYDTVPCILVDGKDNRGRKIALMDNHANDRASYDIGALLLHLQSLGDDLRGSGYTSDDVADLLAHVTAPSLDELEDQHGSDEDFALTVKVTLELTAAVRNRWEGFRKAWADDDMALGALLNEAGVDDD